MRALLARGSLAVIGHTRCCRSRPLAAVRRWVWLLGFVVALAGLSPIDPVEARSRNSQSSQKQNRNNANDNDRQNDRRDDKQNDSRQNDRQQTNKNAKESNRQDDDDDGKDDASRQVRPATQQRADKNAKEKQDDDDDGPGDGNNGKNDPGTARSNRATSTVKAQDTTPPDNLVDWWKWLTKPVPPADNKGQPLPQPTAPGPAAASKAQPVAQNSTASGTRAAPATRPKPRAIAPAILLDPEAMFIPNEVLALNLGREGRAHARTLQFTPTGSVNVPNVGVVTRLLVPNDMGTLLARLLLQNDLPANNFGLNYVYRTFRNAADSGPGLGGQAGRPAAAGGCSPDRCYGAALINWQPHLAECATSIKVGVIDTGFDEKHPAFNGRRFPRREFSPASSGKASDWHGTGVFSLLAGDPDSGTPGLIPNAQFFVADTFFADGGGNVVTDTFSMLQALGWMQKEGVEIVNMSLAGPKDAFLGKAVKEMSAQGTVFVAAAGNGGPAGAPSFPAAYEEVIAVTAVDRKRKNYPYATRGPHIDLAAPGVGIWVALPGGREGTLTGTSFAAPYVTAVVAAMYASTQSKSGDARLNPKMRFLNNLRTVDLGPAGRDQTYGEGLVQAPTTCNRDNRRVPPFRNVPTAQVLWPGVIQNVSLHHD